MFRTCSRVVLMCTLLLTVYFVRAGRVRAPRLLAGSGGLVPGGPRP